MCGFLVSLRSNLRRRRWLWPVCMLAVLAAYTLYPLWIRMTGIAGETSDLPSAGVITGAVTGGISLLIAANGFGYLHDIRKVDMYHSQPVTIRRRFYSIYTGGIVFFAASLILAQLMGLVAAAYKGTALEGYFPVRLLMALVITVLYFLCIYNITIFAFSITGHSLMGVLVAAVLIVYVDLWQRVYLTSLHFKTLSEFFSVRKIDISIIDLYFHNIDIISDSGSSLYSSFDAFWKSSVLLLIWCLVFYVMGKRTYIGRPAESSGKLIAFYSSHMLIKLMIVIPVSLLMGEATYESFYLMPELMQALSMIITAYVSSFLIELVFEQSIRSAARAVGSYIFALVVIFGLFGAFRLWENRFDSYIPDPEELESFAVFNPLNSYYYFYNVEFDDEGRILRYYDAPDFVENEMILTDTDAILTLARKSLDTDYHEMRSPLPLQVFYRIRGSSPRARQIWVDMDEEENRTYLNRIMGPAYYKIGIWQCFTGDVPEGADVSEVRYTDSATGEVVILGSGRLTATRMVRAWRNAMVMYDYDHVRYSEIIGQVEVWFTQSPYKWVMPVYPDMIYNINEAVPDHSLLDYIHDNQ